MTERKEEIEQVRNCGNTVSTETDNKQIEGTVELNREKKFEVDTLQEGRKREGGKKRR